jgi:hypothetical protein
VAPEDRFRLVAQPVDNCGNVGADAGVDVRSVGRGCFRAPGGPGPEPDASGSGTWQSELRGSQAQGQVIVDGTVAVFPGEGSELFTSALAPGVHRFEATLVEAARDTGRGATTWRFDLAGLHVRPGTLRVLAGQAVQAGASEVTFRLRGQSGERVVFEFEVGPRAND